MTARAVHRIGQEVHPAGCSAVNAFRAVAGTVCRLPGIKRELTGSDGRKGILEIKTTEIRRSLDWKKWDGQVPDYYYAQIVHQLLATGYDFAILKARMRERGEYG